MPAIDRLAAECPVALAVSLHAPDDALRDELVPINRKYPLAELLPACRRYLDVAPRDEALTRHEGHARIGCETERAVEVEPQARFEAPRQAIARQAQALAQRAHAHRCE